MYLFIHGTGATNSFWLPQIRAILSLDNSYSDASILETFTITLPGHPRADKLFDLEDTEKLIKDSYEQKLGLQKKMASKLLLSGKAEIVAGLRSDKIILVGHSVGGVIALNFTTTNIGMVEKIVLISTPNQYNQKLVKLLNWFYHKIIFTKSLNFLRSLKNFVPSLRWKTALQIFIENPKRKGFKSLMDIVINFNFENIFKKLTFDEQLKIMKIPILAISGSSDNLCRPSEVRKIGEVLSSNAEMVKSKKTIIQVNSNKTESSFTYKLYKGAGHNTMDEDLVSFVYDFREFLKV